jgi:glucose-1-phosphate thymidylyltransferase
VACEFLLRAYRDAGTDRAYLILRAGKWDIPAYLGDGHTLGLPLGYLMMRHPYGVPYTLDQATPFVGDATVLLGFPDILFETRTPVYPRLLDELETTGADVVLGLFPSDRPDKGDMVDTDAEGRVRAIVIKSRTTALRQAWIVAVWTPAFTRFLHEELDRRSPHTAEDEEFYLGHLFLAAVAAGIDVRGVPFPDGRYVDLGTPGELATYAGGPGQ